jgi:hypothetical protein
VLALTFSLLLTFYLIVPEAIFRFFFGINIPTRTFTLTTTETAYRAVLVAFFPFWIALAICWWCPLVQQFPFEVEKNSVQQRRLDYKIVTAAMYSDAEYTKLQHEFWPALTRASRRQARLALYYFLLIGIEGYTFGLLAARYGKYKNNRIYIWWSDRILSSYISQWHPLLLSSHLLPNTVVQADILCTNNVLYQGNVSQSFLKDGQLSGIILKYPRRFNREQYHDEKTKHVADSGQVKKPEKKDFWIEIPSMHLYFFADKILNMNLTYVPDKISSPIVVEQFLTGELPSIAKEMKLTVSVSERPTPMAGSVQLDLKTPKKKSS